MADKPKVNSASERELNNIEKQFKEFEQEVQDLTLDRMNAAPVEEIEAPKVSQKDVTKSKDVYLKPKRSISSPEKFNEKFRKEFNFQKEYVNFIAQNNEVIGEDITLWTKPFPGVPAEEWVVPTNKPIWGPRYLAERIKACTYHRLSMNEGQDSNLVDGSGVGRMYGKIVVDNTIQRLDAQPVSKNRSIFMGKEF